MADSFRIRAADVLGLSPDWILCGNGSDDILTILTRALVGQGDTIRNALPQLYPVPHAGGNPRRRVSGDHFQSNWLLSPEFLVPDASVKLSIVPNPNSPSGTLVPSDQLRQVADSLDCPLLIDEAYVDFADRSCLDLVRDNENIMISRDAQQILRTRGAPFRLFGGSATDD